MEFMRRINDEEPVSLKSPLPVERLTLLVLAYAPELRSELDAIRAAQGLLSPDLVHSVLEPGQDTAEDARNLSGLFDAMGAMHKACEDLAAGAAESVRARYKLAGDFD